MAFGPKIIKKDPFSQTLRGTFGRFKTATSRDVYYLMSSIPIDDIDDLSTASDLFSRETARFDELIQRDIDRLRVKKMANEYLVATHDKVVFFPPLLACIVLFKQNGSIQHQYETTTQKIDVDGESRVFRATWDEDGFELSLALGDKKVSDRQIELTDGSTEWFHDAGQIRINPKRAKLVVLDGQHRLEAMRLVRKGVSSEILNKVEIPVCLIFTPRAIEGSTEDMVENFRELFVRVNEEAKKVSGHFYILLKDDSYSAMAIREMAEVWRSDKSQGYDLLHLLEWNQRVEEQTRRRHRSFSITTISIVYDVLKTYIFKDQLASTLLRFEEVKSDFERADPEHNYLEITDQTNSKDVDDIVLKQIKKYLVPALSELFLTPTPYKRLQTEVKNAFGKLQKEVLNHDASYSALDEYLVKYKYDNEIAEAGVKANWGEFTKWISVNNKDHIFFLHAFQQGLLRTWISFCAVMNAYGIDATTSARATVAALEILALKPEIEYLASNKKYGRRVLWKNEQVNFGVALWTREAWTDILILSLLKKEVRSAAVSLLTGQTLEVQQKVSTKLQGLGEDAAKRYCTKLQRELLRDTYANFSDLVERGKFLSLQTLQNGDSSAKEKFDQEISALSEVRFQEAKIELSNILEIEVLKLSSGDQ